MRQAGALLHQPPHFEEDSLAQSANRKEGGRGGGGGGACDLEEGSFGAGEQLHGMRPQAHEGFRIIDKVDVRFQHLGNHPRSKILAGDIPNQSLCKMLTIILHKSIIRPQLHNPHRYHQPVIDGVWLPNRKICSSECFVDPAYAILHSGNSRLSMCTVNSPTSRCDFLPSRSRKS